MSAVPPMVDAAVAAISDGAAVDERLNRNMRRGLRDAIEQWFRPTPSPASGRLHFALGRSQSRSGRSLAELMAFYRVAGQAVWRRLTEVGPGYGLEAADLCLLVEAAFVCVDELSSHAAAGFAEEQLRRSETWHSRRSELLRQLLCDPQPPREVLDVDAQAAGVELTSTVAVFVGESAHLEQFAQHGRDFVVLGPRGGEFVGALFDPHGPYARARLAAVSEHAKAQLALGPAVQLERIRDSLRQARDLLALLQSGAVSGGALVQAEDEEVALLLSRDRRLAAQIVRRRLAPLELLPSQGSRESLTETLRAWLCRPGGRKTLAYELGVHPQTVSYRIARLRDLFGGALDDPDQRFELELALRLQPLVSPSRVQPRAQPASPRVARAGERRPPRTANERTTPDGQSPSTIVTTTQKSAAGKDDYSPN
jgi:hypothetical protein